MMRKFSFKPLKNSDLGILCSWFENQHVLEWWNDHLTAEEIKEKYGKRINNEIIYPYIAYLDNKPIAFIQYYWANKVGDGWCLNEDDTTVGMDQFIGDENFINKGYGTLMIKEFIQFLFKNSKIQKIITEADPNNHRARRCYQKVGFHEEGEINTPDGKSLLMTVKRQK